MALRNLTGLRPAQSQKDGLQQIDRTLEYDMLIQARQSRGSLPDCFSAMINPVSK